MLNSIGGFGTFLFFGVINICFIPILYIFYPETKRRTLEEIDVIFAKAYTQKEWYVKVADELPKLSIAEIESEAMKWGIGGEQAGRIEDGSSTRSGIIDETKPSTKA